MNESPSERIPRALKKVQLRPQRNDVAEQIEYAFSLSPVTSRILAARGFEPGEELQNYLVPTLRSGLPNPQQLKNLDAAAECVASAVTTGQGIAIACDFDVDGLSSGAMLYQFLLNAGANSAVYVPDRFAEGYGLNERIIRDAKADGCSILVTLDYGTTNHHELEFAKSLGLTTIVIDHHHVDSVPPADVFINPQQPGCGFARGDLSAAGLCWFFIVALSKLLPAKESLDPKRYLDLACLGTICDMVPLRGANRIIARRGLECLSSTERVGLRALKDVMGVGGGKRMSCSHVSFGIGPRLNAAGRMVSGDLVIELLTTESSGKAEKLAKKLHKLNQQRQATEEEVKLSAISQVDRRGGLPDGIVAWDRTYHTGVIGIVAQRLVEEFYRPSAVMGYENGFFKGSVRGIQGMSVVEVLSATSQHLEKFGGHAGAGGFSIREEMLEPFAEAFEQECAKAIREVSKEPVVNADTICDLNEITPAIVHEMKRFEPLGMGNPGPQIMLQGLEVRDVKTLKNAHLKATLSNGNRTISGMLWRTTEHPSLQVGNRVTLVGKPDLNTFFGHSEMQINIQAVEHSV